MGGAYTALADDAAGGYYNPAGPAFTHGDSLSVSTSLYGLVGGSYRDALGQGLDFTYEGINLIPTAASSLVHIARSPQDRDSPLVVGFDIFAPHSFEIDRRTDARGGATTLFFTRLDKTILAGPLVAYRLTPRVSAGLALYGMLHTLSDRTDVTDVRAGTVPGAQSVTQFSTSREQLDLGALLGLGVRMQLHREIYVGLALRTPPLAIYGRGRAFTRLIMASGAGEMPPTVISATDEVDTRRMLPTRFSAGIAWARNGRFALSADLVAYMPIRYRATVSPRDPSLNQTVARQLVVDASIGGEYYVAQNYPVRAGLFTDFSGAPVPDPAGSTDDRLDLYGATLSVTRVSERSSTTVGLVGAYGTIRLLGVDLAQGSYSPFPSRGTQWRLYLLVSSSLDF